MRKILYAGRSAALAFLIGTSAYAADSPKAFMVSPPALGTVILSIGAEPEFDFKFLKDAGVEIVVEASPPNMAAPVIAGKAFGSVSLNVLAVNCPADDPCVGVLAQADHLAYTLYVNRENFKKFLEAKKDTQALAWLEKRIAWQDGKGPKPPAYKAKDYLKGIFGAGTTVYQPTPTGVSYTFADTSATQGKIELDSPPVRLSTGRGDVDPNAINLISGLNPIEKGPRLCDGAIDIAQITVEAISNLRALCPDKVVEIVGIEETPFYPAIGISVPKKYLNDPVVLKRIQAVACSHILVANALYTPEGYEKVRLYLKRVLKVSDDQAKFVADGLVATTSKTGTVDPVTAEQIRIRSADLGRQISANGGKPIVFDFGKTPTLAECQALPR